MRSVTAAAIDSATNGSSVRLYSSRNSASPVGGGVLRDYRDVRVLGEVERVETAFLHCACELHRPDRESVMNSVTPKCTARRYSGKNLPGSNPEGVGSSPSRPGEVAEPKPIQPQGQPSDRRRPTTK